MRGNFDSKHAAISISRGIRQYVRESGHRGTVLGVSGGVDSAVCAMLAVKALGEKNVFGLVMPALEAFADETKDAVEVARKAGIPYKIINIGPATGALNGLVSMAGGRTCGKTDSGNIAARTRMILLYGAAAHRGYLVLGTGNKSELLLGYFTKYGDGGADLLPIGDLYKWQVRKLAKELGVPEGIIKKTPTAGLWKGQTDEGELGFSYDFADKVLGMFVEAGMDGKDIIKEVGKEKDVRKIYSLVKKSSHKRSPPRIFSLALARWR